MLLIVGQSGTERLLSELRAKSNVAGWISSAEVWHLRQIFFIASFTAWASVVRKCEQAICAEMSGMNIQALGIFFFKMAIENHMRTDVGSKFSSEGCPMEGEAKQN